MDPSFENVEATALSVFRSQFYEAPQVISSAPGRVNLIGEHTDYNDGPVFPAAINRRIAIAAGPRPDRTIEVYAGNLNTRAKFSLDDLAPTRINSWLNYLRGVTELLHRKGDPACGANLVVYGNVPRGGGLSSSAALEVAYAHTLMTLTNTSHPPMDIARLCQQAEHEWAGVHCGIMDQCISAMGRKDAGLHLDCRSLTYRHVPLPAGARLVICDTGVKRALASSAYNTRRAECRAGVAVLAGVIPDITSLRDVSLDAFLEYQSLLEPTVRRRCRHVITEIARVEQTVKAITADDLALAGKLMYDSHISLQRDYEVSCPELDAVVDICAEVDGVYGARMTGGGFGGSALCLVHAEDVPETVRRLTIEYPQKTGRKPSLIVTGAEDGVSARRI